jgi:hypothetical protein
VKDYRAIHEARRHHQDALRAARSRYEAAIYQACNAIRRQSATEPDIAVAARRQLEADIASADRELAETLKSIRPMRDCEVIDVP